MRRTEIMRTTTRAPPPLPAQTPQQAHNPAVRLMTQVMQAWPASGRSCGEPDGAHERAEHVADIAWPQRQPGGGHEEGTGHGAGPAAPAAGAGPPPPRGPARRGGPA